MRERHHRDLDANRSGEDFLDAGEQAIFMRVDLVADRDVADYYEACVTAGGKKRDAKAVANWVMGDIAAAANAQGLSVAQTHVPAAHVAELVDLIGDNTISGKIAKDVLALMFGEERDASPREIVEH